MPAKVSFFRVGDGDMTLLTLDSGKTVLIDCRIRKAADDPDDETPDVAGQLKDRLKTDSDGRAFVDAMLLSHPDQDHCCGLKTHFHFGPLSDYVKADKKIVIREQWSSPIVFRRASKDHVLCEDAKAWQAEARRRVKVFRADGVCGDGDRILILGEDVDGKTDDLTDILVTIDTSWNTIDGGADDSFEALLLAPLKSDDDEEEETLTKNDFSTVVRFRLASGDTEDACRFLTGGDAGVAIWEKLWDRHKDDPESLVYDLLLTPHHCSWRSLSWDSWSDLDEDAQLSQDARDALAQARDGASLIASCKSITDDDADPPCVRAEREYKAVAKDVKGEFVCAGDDGPEPLEYEIAAGGLKKVSVSKRAAAAAPAIIIGRQPISHG